MFHRVYTKPFTRINEAWNFSNQFDSSVGETYRDPLIKGKTNEHLQSTHVEQISCLIIKQ